MYDPPVYLEKKIPAPLLQIGSYDTQENSYSISYLLGTVTTL